MAVGRFEQGQFRSLSVVAIVLLILGTVAARVVCGDDHKPRIDSSVGRGEERICGHIQTYMLHGAQSPNAAQAGTERGLKGSFSFTDLRSDLLMLRHILSISVLRVPG